MGNVTVGRICVKCSLVCLCCGLGPSGAAVSLGSGDTETGPDDGDFHAETQAGCHGEGPAGLRRAVPRRRGMRSQSSPSHIISMSLE